MKKGIFLLPGRYEISCDNYYGSPETFYHLTLNVPFYPNDLLQIFVDIPQ